MKLERINKSNNFLPEERLSIYAKIIQLVVGAGMTTNEVRKELGIGHMTISRALNRYFPIRSDTAVIVTLESKINKQESPEE